jgi:L-malate glycosyltransferase
MRICYISVGTFPHIDPYLEYFHRAGHDVHFISLSPGPERAVPTYNVGFGGRYGDKHGKWKYPLSMLRARKMLKQIKPDILHVHYATSGGLAALVCDFHPAIVTVHGSDLITSEKSRLWRAILKRVFHYADCVNLVSQSLADIAINMGVDTNKIEVLTPGIDTTKYTYIKKDQGITNPLKMVCTRRHEAVFDHQTIIDALVLLKDKNIPFKMTFIGSGSLTDSLKQQVKSLGLEGCVDFTGNVSNDKMPELLACNDIYLSASLWDGASLSLFEAMAAGLFPIVSDIKANSAWLRHGIDGFLYKTGNAEDLADCIQQFISKPRLAVAAALRNREIVIQKADRNTNMRRLETVYEELVRKT